MFSFQVYKEESGEAEKICVFQITMLTWYLHGIADGFSGVWPHLEETQLSALFLLLIKLSRHGGMIAGT